MIEWTPTLAVGHDEIDAQHQELFRRANAFVEGLHDRTRQDVGILLSYLRLYVITHFGAEEDFMREASYPGYAQHKAEHDGFVKDLLALSTEHEKKKGPGLDAARVGAWIQRWLVAHVSARDTELAKYLLARTG